MTAVGDVPADLAIMAALVISQSIPHGPKPPNPTTIPTKQTEAPLSFAAMAARPTVLPRFLEIQFSNRSYGHKDGVPDVSFSSMEYQALTKRFANTLIANFQFGRPTLSKIKNFMKSNWVLKGRVTIIRCWDDRHVVIILDSLEDDNSTLTFPHWKIGHTFFRFFRWTKDYNPKKETTTITKWMRLRGQPTQFFDKGNIRAIGSSFAEFLDIDNRTKDLSALSYARACVELDVSKI